MKSFEFTNEQYEQFRAFLAEMNKINWGVWPPAVGWLSFRDLPSYGLAQYEQDNGKTFIVVKFDYQVITPNGMGKRFKYGGDYLYKPVCQYF
jgi:hypothetical protein